VSLRADIETHVDTCESCRTAIAAAIRARHAGAAHRDRLRGIPYLSNCTSSFVPASVGPGGGDRVAEAAVVDPLACGDPLACVGPLACDVDAVEIVGDWLPPLCAVFQRGPATLEAMSPTSVHETMSSAVSILPSDPAERTPTI
jgi:hypothetical protein